MLKIAICDDDIVVCSHIENIINKNFVEILVEIFYSGEKLIQAIEKIPLFDIIFLDIEMEALSGIDVGAKIRKDFNNNTTQIVYISAKEDYAMKLFKVRPFDFLIKPIAEKDIVFTIKSAMKLCDKDEDYLECYIDGQYSRIPCSKVIYIESQSRKVKIVTTDGDYFTYQTILELEKAIISDDFRVVHRSYLVNFNHLKTYAYDEIIMTNDDVVLISQSKRKEIRTYFLRRRSNYID